MRAWRELTPPSDDTHAIAIGQVRTALRSGPPDGRNIDFILRNMHGRWLSTSQDRLRQFGYGFDSY